MKIALQVNCPVAYIASVLTLSRLGHEPATAEHADLIITEDDVLAELGQVVGKKVIRFHGCHDQSPTSGEAPSLDCNELNGYSRRLEQMVKA